MWRIRVCFVLVSIFFFHCSNQHQIPEDQVLVYVGEKTITIQDFIRRSEYTIRPIYCRQSNYIHKKIILNSLIAEKLLAIEMENQNDKQLNSEGFLSFIKGRKEQAMRKIFYDKKFHKDISIEEKEINEKYQMAGRTIKVNYINLPDMKTALKVKQLKVEGIGLDSIYMSLYEGAVPARFINWFDREPDEIHEQLFKKGLKKNQLLGPFRTETNTYLLMEASGWIDQPVITEEEKQLRWADTKDRISETAAKKLYFDYVKKLMSGYQMKLNKDVFDKYSTIAADYYLKNEDEKENAINQAIWQNKETELLDSFDQRNALDPSSRLFTYRDKDWNVQSFNDLLKSHPLVFRKNKMNRSEFRAQLKFAMADLLRDVEITNQCYDLGLDDDWRVKANESQWYDSYASKRHIQLSFPESADMQQILDHYNPIIDSLQQVYSNKIQINTRLLEDLKLTTTDMMVTQKGVPYPIIVPGFPIITTDDRLDYGSKLN